MGKMMIITGILILAMIGVSVKLVDVIKERDAVIEELGAAKDALVLELNSKAVCLEEKRKAREALDKVIKNELSNKLEAEKVKTSVEVAKVKPVVVEKLVEVESNECKEIMRSIDAIRNAGF